MKSGFYDEDYDEIFYLLHNKIPVVTLQQLTVFIALQYEIPASAAEALIFFFSKDGKLILSPNNLITTREKITRISKREPEIEFMSHFALRKALVLTDEAQNEVDAFWLVLKDFPYSKDFFITRPPIILTFMHSKKERIIEVVNFPKGKEYLINEMLKLHFNYDNRGRLLVERYALLEDPDAIGAIQKNGFTEFYHIDKREQKHKVIRLKKNIVFEDAWGD